MERVLLVFIYIMTDHCLAKSFWAIQCASITSSTHEMHSILISVLFLRQPHGRLFSKKSLGKLVNTW